MSRILVLSVLVASLSTIVACGASGSATGPSATPASASVADAHDEASWTPPGEMSMTIADAKEAPPAPHRAAKGHPFRPNRNDRPTTGAVHAATY